ncbi:MAG: TRAP transporter large permease [Clostridiales bacterium]|nr:TRAP transporter large permease [Clostridiales bacterium]
MMELGISFVILVVLLIAGVPVMYCFGASLLYASYTLGYTATGMFPTIYGKLSSVVLLSIPLFILAGKIMEHGRIGDALVGFVELFVGKIKGSLTIITTVACAVFGAICGSGMATLSCIGSIMMPKMAAKRYPMEIAAAVSCCAAPIGMLIPPSSLCIVVAWAANLSVTACFLSTLIPGIILTTLISLVSYIMMRNKDVDAGSGYDEGVALRDVIWPRTKYAIPALIMPVIILGGIYGGFITPTEAAAVASIYTIPVAIFIYRGTTCSGMKTVLMDSAKTTGIIMVMVVMTMALGQILTMENMPMKLLDALIAISGNKLVILLTINVFLILIGMIMDDTCATMLTAPLLIPIGVALGVNPYQMCAILVTNIGMGNVTPPTAPFLYMASGMAGVNAAKVMKPVILIIVFAYVPTLLLTTFIPELSTWLPNLVLGAKIAL